jgi:RNA polymerase sigma-70 factor (ECF subfamily)
MFAAALQAPVMADELVTAEEGGRPEGDAVPTLPLYDWTLIVDGIRDGDPKAMESLYRIFAKGVRFFLLRNLGSEELEDRVHDCFVIVIEAIQNGELREPERLMGYVRTVVKRQIAATIDVAVQQRRRHADFEDTLFCVSDWRENPERTVIARQRAEIARRVLAGIPARDREILNRFYVLEQSQDQICRELGLSYNQFRLLKSRAKARFGELGRRLATGAGIRFRRGFFK